MGFCTRRHLFLTVCVLQMVFAVEKQVFDFLGFLWIPIFVNFFEIVFVIFGFFGAYQHRQKYIIAYLLWHLLWIAWNVFIICLYLNIANLDHETNKVLKLDPKSDSWWKKDGPGCKIVNVDEVPLKYDGCYIDYISVEVFQAGLQSALAIFCVVVGIFVSKTLSKDAEASLSRKPSHKRTSLYSIEFSSHADGGAHGDSDNGFDEPHPPLASKPMTPRRVKRRSVMQRGTTARHSGASRRSHSHGRSSRRLTQNPVTALLGQQQQQQQRQKAQQRLYEYEASDSPLPTYYGVPTAPADGADPHRPWSWQQGHANPSYQQSTTSLNDRDDPDELYANRPPSARSSYSNFHGARASYAPAAPKPQPQPHHHSHATPQVPQKRAANANRNSVRQIAFMNSAPPAYTSERTPPAVDTETRM